MLPSKCLLRSPLAFACGRGISSKAKSQSAHDKRMEALVSLYHQSDTFITPENLSSVIDQAFTQPMHVFEDNSMHKLSELSKMNQTFKESPKFFLGRDDGPSSTHSENMGPGWTESRSRRIDRVHRALIGTQKDGRPSWLALKENGERVKSQLEKDNRR